MKTPSLINSSLKTSGSITFTDADSNSLYSISGTATLVDDLSYLFSASGTLKKGYYFNVWFCNTTVTLSGHSVFLVGTDISAVVAGSANVFFNCSYNGSSWTVTSVQGAIIASLSGYVTTGALATALADYTTTAALTSLLGGYATLANPTFTGSVVVPNQTLGDNSTKAANTAFVAAAIAVITSTYATVAAMNTAISAAISSATTSITSAYTAAITSATALFRVSPAPGTIGAWAAGTYDLATLATGTRNKIEPSSVTGNIVLECLTPPTDPSSTIVLILLYSGGAFTVTAGTGVALSTITGVDTHRGVLTLVWSVVASAYVQESYSAN